MTINTIKKLNNYKITFFGFLIVLILFGTQIFAASDTHTVKQTITDGVLDLPSAPQNLTATAVSTSQIDLSWEASSAGDFPVDGYQIFRDSVAIATTTSITYNDAGLTSETLYTYQVRAFDTSVNYSTLSNEASATTLSEDTVEDDTVGGGGGSIFELKKLSVEPNLFQAVIKIEASFPSKLIFSWGQTPNYEIEKIASGDFQKTHTLFLNDLNPNTKYYFEFELFDSIGRRIKISNQTFKTLSLPFSDLLLNVSDFKASSDQEKIVLSWNNPSIDFKNIRIIRSTSSFPRDPFDGELVYLGSGESYIDRDLEKDKDYFYAAFVESRDGRFSSGSIARGKLLLPGEKEPELFAGIIDLPASQVSSLIRGLTLRDFDFIQDGKRVPVLADNSILIKGDRIFKVSIDYNKLPEILKTLAITLKDPDNPEKVFNFLLRINEDKTAYEATIAPLGREGAFSLNVSILDHKNRGLKHLSGFLKASLPFGIPIQNFDFLSTMFFLLLLLILILVARIISRYFIFFFIKNEATT